jgi:hypothetical protein
MFDVISVAFSAFVYGLLATMALMAILYFILHEINRNAVRNIPFFLTGIVLFVLLTIQFTLLFGAMEAKGMSGAVEIYISQTIEQGQLNGNYQISGAESQRLLDEIIKRYPLIGAYVNICNFSGTHYSDLPSVVGNTLRDFLSGYMWRRVFWTLGFVVVSMAIALLVPKAGYRDASNRSSSRRERSYTRRSERRPSRRR